MRAVYGPSATERPPGTIHAWFPSVRSQVRVSAGSPLAAKLGRYIHVWRCGGLSTVSLQIKDPNELFMKRKEFSPGSGYRSCHDMTYAVKDEVGEYS